MGLISIEEKEHKGYFLFQGNEIIASSVLSTLNRLLTEVNGLLPEQYSVYRDWASVKASETNRLAVVEFVDGGNDRESSVTLISQDSFDGYRYDGGVFTLQRVKFVIKGFDARERDIAREIAIYLIGTFRLGA